MMRCCCVGTVYDLQNNFSFKIVLWDFSPSMNYIWFYVTLKKL